MEFNFVLSTPDEEIKMLLAEINDVPVESSLRDITAGYARAYKIKAGSRTIGLEICRIDVNHLNQREFVILRCIKAPGYDLAINFFDILDAGEIALCKLLNCQIVRRHVDRAGMIPALQKYNYYITEVVLKRRIIWEKEALKVLRLQQALPRTLTSALPPPSKASQ